METGMNEVCAPGFKFLEEAQIRRIHRAVLRVLEETGVRVLHDEAAAMLKSGGARVGEDRIVRIPGWMVEEAIASAPKNLVIYNRDKEPAMELGGRRIHFG
ncbi:MAG: trimethylamine methyltransferase, partial [Desulfobacterales bacterium]|nr:trimethylamine methyltransferase [Desulfobacterales bacterium]